LWAKRPEERAASLRRSTERAQSVGGTAKSPSPRRVGSGLRSESDRASTPSRTGPRLSGRLHGTDAIDGAAVVDTGDRHGSFRKKSDSFRNPKGWARF
jgi:hypothetical protein